MEFLPIFAREESVFWSVCFPEDEGEDSFRKFMNQIYNYHFLTDFFKLNKPLLGTSFWNNISTQTAYLQVLEEADDLEQELKCYEIGLERPGHTQIISISQCFGFMRLNWMTARW